MMQETRHSEAVYRNVMQANLSFGRDNSKYKIDMFKQGWICTQ